MAWSGVAWLCSSGHYVGWCGVALQQWALCGVVWHGVAAVGVNQRDAAWLCSGGCCVAWLCSGMALPWWPSLDTVLQQVRRRVAWGCGRCMSPHGMAWLGSSRALPQRLAKQWLVAAHPS